MISRQATIALLVALRLAFSSAAAAEAQRTTIALPAASALLLTDALASVEQMRAEGEIAPVEIMLPTGTYELAAPIVLSPSIVGEGLILHAQHSLQAIISGGQRLPCQATSSGFCRYSLPEEWPHHERPRQLVVEGQLRAAARLPRTGCFRIQEPLADRRSGFITKQGDIPSQLAEQAAATDLVLLHDWSSSRLPVASWDAQSRTLKTLGPVGCSAPHYAIDYAEKQPRYWLEGAPLAAQQPGDWYYEPTSREIFVKVDTSTTKESAPEIILPRLEQLLIASGNAEGPLTGLSLEGIVWTNARFHMPPGGMACGQATKHEPRTAEGTRASEHYPLLPAAVHLEQAQDCRVTSCNFVNLGGSALWMGSRTRDCLVESCHVERVGGNGVNVGEGVHRRVGSQSWRVSAPQEVATGNRVLNNEISDIGQVFPGAVGIWAGLNSRLEISGNHVHDCPYSGISLGWLWNTELSPARENRIVDNKVESVMNMLSDGAGIYTLGNQPESVIERNVINGVALNVGKAESNGMFFDEGSTGFTIRENTIRDVAKSPLRFHDGGINHVLDNRWELANEQTPPVRYNDTPRENIRMQGNRVLVK